MELIYLLHHIRLQQIHFMRVDMVVEVQTDMMANVLGMLGAEHTKN